MFAAGDGSEKEVATEVCIRVAVKVVCLKRLQRYQCFVRSIGGST